MTSDINLQSLESRIKEAANKQATQDQVIQAIFLKHFNLEVTENTPADKRPPEGYMAYGLLAVDVACRLANLFISINTNKGVHRVAVDLTYQMNTNEFWQKNASVLLPIIHVALNTHTDGIALQIERAQSNEYSSHDMLISAAKAAPLELFPIIAYLLGGPPLMSAVSLALKKDLAPYIVG